MVVFNNLRKGCQIILPVKKYTNPLNKMNNDKSKRKKQTSASGIFYRLTASEILSVQRAKEILEEYTDDKPPSLKELSRLVGINELKLKTGFGAIFNTSIYKWISTQRMVKAKDLALNTNMPIKEISMLSGYSMVCNFITAFKRQYGSSPGKLRKGL